MLNGKRLREIRERYGFSQDELAQRVGITNTHLRRFEAGGGNPSAKTIVSLAKVLGVTSDYLLGLVDEEKTLYKGEPLSELEHRLLIAIRQGDMASLGDALFLLGEIAIVNSQKRTD